MIELNETATVNIIYYGVKFNCNNKIYWHLTVSADLIILNFYFGFLIGTCHY